MLECVNLYKLVCDYLFWVSAIRVQSKKSKKCKAYTFTTWRRVSLILRASLKHQIYSSTIKLINYPTYLKTHSFDVLSYIKRRNKL